MSLTININTDNAAFDDPGPECARILREIAEDLDKWDGYDKFSTVFDVNGNDVGRWRLNKKVSDLFTKGR